MKLLLLASVALGFVATVRDRTDLEHLTGELDSARGLTEGLRSQVLREKAF